MFESPVLPFIAFFAMAFGIVYISVTARHRQRMAMIDKGLDLRGPESNRRDGGRLTLKFGLLLVGLGVGILCGYMLNLAMPEKPTEWNPHPEDNPVFYFVSIFICGGAALIADHVLAAKKKD